MRYFIGITGISTAGKSTLGTILLSNNINPEIFPIPHTTRREPRQDDDSRLIRCISEKEFGKSEFLTVDQNYGTLMSDYRQFLGSENLIAISVVSCNEIPDLKKEALSCGLVPIFVSLTLTESLEKEEKEIEKRFKNYFSEKVLDARIQRDKDLAKNFFFNKKYLESNNVISFSQESGEVLNWVDNLKDYMPISYNEDLIKDIEIIKLVRN